MEESQLTDAAVARPRVIVLTGFMGTGKTTVGKRLAARLGWIFVDTDAVIANREGRPIAEIFSAAGEAFFRTREREVIAESARLTDAVIATGGGAIVDDANFEVLRRAGLFVCLTASAERILERTSGEDRPLLQGGDRERRVGEMLAARADAYARVPHHVDTTNLTPDSIVDRILGLYRAEDSAGQGDA